MKKSTFEQMDGTYREEGDHLLPNLTVPGNISVGIWGKRRRRYLRKHRQTLYTALLFGGKLDTHLAEIDRQAENIPITAGVKGIPCSKPVIPKEYRTAPSTGAMPIMQQAKPIKAAANPLKIFFPPTLDTKTKAKNVSAKNS